MLADTIVARALASAGLSYGDPVKRPLYKDAILPTDKEPQRDGMARTMISCMLFIRGTLALDEVDGMAHYGNGVIDVLRAPYANHITHIDTLLTNLAVQRGLHRDSHDQEAMRELVKPAGMIVIGAGGSLPPAGSKERVAHVSAWGGVAHGIIVTDVKTIGGKTIVEHVAGGQIDPLNLDPIKGPRCTKIERGEDELIQRASGLWLGNRKLNWGMDLGALPVMV